MFEAIKNKNEKVYEKVVEQIRQKISKGELKAGDKLPPERELTEILNVSRSSLREAMKTLEIMGLVEIKHGQGIFISENRQENLIELLKPFIFDHTDTIKNIFEVRKTLETQAVVWAAERGTKEEKKALEKELMHILSMKKGESGLEHNQVKKHNEKFHYLISAMSHNPVLIKIMGTLNEFIDEVYEKTMQIPTRVDRSLQEHEQIIKKIKDGDQKGARKLMLQHLQTVEKEIENWGSLSSKITINE